MKKLIAFYFGKCSAVRNQSGGSVVINDSAVYAPGGCIIDVVRVAIGGDEDREMVVFFKSRAIACIFYVLAVRGRGEFL